MAKEAEMRMMHSEDDGGHAPESPGEGPEAGQQTLSPLTASRRSQPDGTGT